MDFQAGELVFALILIAIILISLSVHEFAHAYVANLFGDTTAKHEGRMTLNPLAHWDPIGTTLLVGLILLRTLGLSGLPVFGWGKPVPVNESNFDRPLSYGIQTAMAGPMSNFILAIIFALVIRNLNLPAVFESVLVTAVFLNLFLMFFNLMPIPPLDGSRLLRLFMSEHSYYQLASNPLFLMGGLFLVIYLLAGLLVPATARLTELLVGF